MANSIENSLHVSWGKSPNYNKEIKTLAVKDGRTVDLPNVAANKFQQNTILNQGSLIVGRTYKCEANDIVSQWEVELEWLGDGWSHKCENIDGYYPCIVTNVKHIVTPKRAYIKKISRCVNCKTKPIITNSTDNEYKFVLQHKSDVGCYPSYKIEIHQNTKNECVDDWNEFNVQK